MNELWGQLGAMGAVDDLSLPWAVDEAHELQEHASTRSFYRLMAAEGGSPASAVLVLYPEDERHEVERYQSTADWMRRAGAPVPEILAVGRRSLLVEDGGDHILAEADLGNGALHNAYGRAADIVRSIQGHGRESEPPNGSWALDADRLQFELGFFEEHTLRGWLGVDSGSQERHQHYERLVAAICRLPIVACHRDYHARNLMVKKDGLLVLDFQDVMWGPQLYDLASLVWDNYCSVPETIQKEVLAGFWGEIGSPLLEIDPTAAVPEIPEGLPPAARQAFCFVALQRHLKALGTFGYQITQAGRIGYEKYVASTWQHARRAAEALEWESFLSVLSPLSHHLRGDLLD